MRSEAEPHPSSEEQPLIAAPVEAFAAPEPFRDPREATVFSGTEPASAPLVELAHAYGVATEFWDWRGEHTSVARHTIVAVLAALDVDARSERSVAQALAEVRDRPWRRVLPDVLVTREGAAPRVPVHVDHGAPVEVWVELEDGTERSVDQEDRWVEPRLVDGRMIGEATFVLPADLPLGWHRLHARFATGSAERPWWSRRRGWACRRRWRTPRAWGFMTQLYSVRSHLSWGLGDLADLARAGRVEFPCARCGLPCWSIRCTPQRGSGPDAALAVSAGLPSVRQPGLPAGGRTSGRSRTCRRADRVMIDGRAEAMRGMNSDPGEAGPGRRLGREEEPRWRWFLQPRSRWAAGVVGFVLRDARGRGPDSTSPPGARLPSDTGADGGVAGGTPRTPVRSRQPAAGRTVRAGRVLHVAAVVPGRAARRGPAARDRGRDADRDRARPGGRGASRGSGRLGAGQGALATRGDRGPPPDAFNQQGQDWSQPPWRPDRLAELGYAALPRHAADGAASCRRTAGGPHRRPVPAVVGSQWQRRRPRAPTSATTRGVDRHPRRWRPTGPGAFVVGEDLGRWSRGLGTTCASGGCSAPRSCGSSGTGRPAPLPPQAWRELCLATVTTHDLPPTSGYLAGEHIELRAAAGAADPPGRGGNGHRRGRPCRGPGPARPTRAAGPERSTERDRVEALHRFLTWTPARLIGVALADAAGDRRR